MNLLYNDLVAACSRIEEKWLKFDNACEYFPSIVWEETERLDLTEFGKVSNQLKLLDHHSVRLNQQLSTFSDMYFQIYNNGRFMVEILNWHGGHVNVHDHDFSAVQFQLKGDSLNVIYDFTESGPHDGALQFGDLKVRNAEIWKEGSRSVVRSGAIDPHGVFHLGRPTTSLLIRTLPTPRLGAQSNYFPTLKAHYNVSTTVQRKRLTGLNLLWTENRAEFHRLFEKFLGEQSLAENFFMMVKFGSRIFQSSDVGIASKFAARGAKESLLVQSVAYNNGIDFFKNKTNEFSEGSQDLRLALFAISAATSRENFNKIKEDLAERSLSINESFQLEKFKLTLSSRDRKLANQYLRLFGMEQKESCHAIV
ncbi:MAG: hypothetical protein CL676_03410 [Bdellovibrionaceae bacterium]|nr:hypothetical protein [Pseudobdellovibrionaceae bacterium]|tara:strand:+ start:725 stop:1822 length:1098 start_codon:yes stop_codon:yes gene_type:complete